MPDEPTRPEVTPPTLERALGLLRRAVKYIDEDHALTPGFTRLARLTDEMRAFLAGPTTPEVPRDYDASFARLRDILDEAFGTQPVRGDAETLTFLEKKLRPLAVPLEKWEAAHPATPPTPVPGERACEACEGTGTVGDYRHGADGDRYQRKPCPRCRAPQPGSGPRRHAGDLIRWGMNEGRCSACLHPFDEPPGYPPCESSLAVVPNPGSGMAPAPGTATCASWCGQHWDEHEHVGGEIPYQDEPRRVRSTRCYCTPDCRSAGKPLNPRTPAPPGEPAKCETCYGAKTIKWRNLGGQLVDRACTECRSAPPGEGTP